MMDTLIDHRFDVEIFKTQVFYCKVLNILTLFLRSIRVQTTENCCRLVFYNNIREL